MLLLKVGNSFPFAGLVIRCSLGFKPRSTPKHLSTSSGTVCSGSIYETRSHAHYQSSISSTNIARSKRDGSKDIRVGLAGL